MQSWQLILSSTPISTEQKRTGALQGKRWNCSKNLVKTRARDKKIITDRAWFKAEPREIKGYYVDKKQHKQGST